MLLLMTLSITSFFYDSGPTGNGVFFSFCYPGYVDMTTWEDCVDSHEMKRNDFFIQADIHIQLGIKLNQPNRQKQIKT